MEDQSTDMMSYFGNKKSNKNDSFFNQIDHNKLESINEEPYNISQYNVKPPLNQKAKNNFTLAGGNFSNQLSLLGHRQQKIKRSTG